MNLLVVGASGFIGRHILAEAKRRGATALGTRASAAADDLVSFDLRHDRLASIEPVRSWEDGSVVVAAAFPQIDRCRIERDLSYAINVVATVQLLRDTVARGLRPVFLSSSFVFDGRRGHYGDRDERSPISEYGRQKAEVETVVERELPDALVVRLDKTIGTDPEEKHLFSEWRSAAVAGQPIRCVERQDFSPTLVDDIARGVLAACERELRGTYNMANPEVISRAALARRFVAAGGFAAGVEEVSQRDLGFVDLRPEKSSLDSRAFIRETALQFTTVDEALRAYLAAVDRQAANDVLAPRVGS